VALVSCAKCGHKVSTTTPRCPGSGGSGSAARASAAKAQKSGNLMKSEMTVGGTFVSMLIFLAGCGAGQSVREVSQGTARPALVANAPASENVPLPTFHPGDSWVEDAGGTKVTRTVKEVDGSSVIIERGIPGVAGVETRMQGTACVAQEDYGDGPITYEPCLKLMGSSLEVGENWSEKLKLTEPSHRWRYVEADGKIVGWESVTVPAGTFRGLRIAIDISGVYYTRDIEYVYVPELNGYAIFTDKTAGWTARVVSYRPTHPVAPAPNQFGSAP
jgi:hypothetical protein